MGTKLAPTYAALVMAYLELKLYDKIEERFGSDHHHNLFYTLRVCIQDNKICSDNKIHGITKALNFTNKC